MNKKRLFLLLILFLVIGFAAVSTTLILNGTIKIGESDFKVVFSDAYVNGEKSDYIITSEKTIEFTADLSTTGEKYVVDYTVLNKSTNYAADLTLKYTGETSEYLSIKNEFDDNTPLEAKKIRDGKITITLIKPTTENITVNVSYEISANALERDKINQYEEEISYLENYENNLNTADSLLNVASEHITGMINEHQYINDAIADLKSGSIDTDEANTRINERIANINNLSASATYEDKNLIDGSMSEPYVIKLETTEYSLPVYNINSTTLGLDNLDDLLLESTMTSIENAYNSLQDYYTKIDGISMVIDSLKTVLSSKKGSLYRIDTDDEVKDEIALKSANEILKKVRQMQNLTYSWVRVEGYTTNEYLTNTINSYADSINLIVENTNFKGVNLLDGTYKDIPNLSTHHLGLNDEELFFYLSSKENVALTRSHLEYAVSKLKNYAVDEYKYADDLMYIYNEGQSAKGAISYLKNTESALNEIHDILHQINALETQIANSPSEQDIESISLEQEQLLAEIDNISNNINYNGISTFNGTLRSITFEFGRREETILQNQISVNALGLSNLLKEEASKGIELLWSAMDIIGEQRGYLGSLQNSYDKLLLCVDSQIEVLSKNNSEEETKKELAQVTVYNILDTLNSCKYILEMIKNGENYSFQEIQPIIEEANNEIRMIDMMVDDARVNGQEILNGTYNNIPNLRSDYLGINDTKLSFKSETESDLDKNIENIDYAINKVNNVLTNLNN